MQRRSFVAASAVGLAGGCGVPAPATGFLDRTLRLDGSVHRYQVYVPRDRPPGPLPLVLALHGGGEVGDDGLLQTAVGLANAIRRHPDRFPALVVFPQSPADGGPGFQGRGGRIALAALDRTLAEFDVDRARISLTGLSMGGNGAWFLAYHHPERFAALLPVCAFVGAFTGRTSGVHYPPVVPGAGADAERRLARRIAHLPVWIFHGDDDAVVSVEESRRMAAALRAEGAPVRYTELAGVGHNAWDPAYGRADVIAWLLAQRRA